MIGFIYLACDGCELQTVTMSEEEMSDAMRNPIPCLPTYLRMASQGLDERRRISCEVIVPSLLSFPPFSVGWRVLAGLGIGRGYGLV